jgi:hypothetical protein
VDPPDEGQGGYGFVLAISAAPGEPAVVTAKSVEPKLEIDGDIDDDSGALRFVYRTTDGDWEGHVAADDRVDGVPVFSWANVRRVGEGRTIEQSWGTAEMFFSSYGDPMARIAGLMQAMG